MLFYSQAAMLKLQPLKPLTSTPGVHTVCLSSYLQGTRNVMLMIKCEHMRHQNPGVTVPTVICQSQTVKNSSIVKRLCF